MVFITWFNTVYIMKEKHVDPTSSYCLVVLVTRLCLALCHPVDCNLPGFSVHGIFQTSILEWVVISFSRGSSPPRGQTHISCIAGGFFTAEPPGKPQTILYFNVIKIHSVVCQFKTETDRGILIFLGKSEILVSNIYLILVNNVDFIFSHNFPP